MNSQGWVPLGLTGLISLQFKGLSRVFSSTTKVSVLQLSAFFMVQLSHAYMTTGKELEDLVSNSILAMCFFCDLGQVTLFLHIWNGNSNSTYCIMLFWGLAEITHYPAFSFSFTVLAGLPRCFHSGQPGRAGQPPPGLPPGPAAGLPLLCGEVQQQPLDSTCPGRPGHQLRLCQPGEPGPADSFTSPALPGEKGQLPGVLEWRLQLLKRGWHS